MTEPDLYDDILDSAWMGQKIRENRAYAQNLYAAMCNNDFQKLDIWPILKNETWAVSWRRAGAIISEIRCEGDYMDWYCSGMINFDNPPRPVGEGAEEAWADYQYRRDNYVSESTVTDEIREDLRQLGWVVIDVNEFEFG